MSCFIWRSSIFIFSNEELCVNDVYNFNISQEKLKQFQERLVEERKKRLEERKKQRKEERRNAYFRQKEEEAQRIREEQLKKGTACCSEHFRV